MFIVVRISAWHINLCCAPKGVPIESSQARWAERKQWTSRLRITHGNHPAVRAIATNSLRVYNSRLKPLNLFCFPTCSQVFETISRVLQSHEKLAFAHSLNR